MCTQNPSRSTDSDLHWCCHLKSKFTSTTSNGKLGVLVEGSQQRQWHPLLRTGSDPRYSKTSGATQAFPSTTGDQGLNWGECLPLISKEHDHTEGGMWEVCCSPWHEAERSLLLSTALVRTLVRTTQQGLALRPRLQGGREAAFGPAIWRIRPLQLLKEKAGATRTAS